MKKSMLKFGILSMVLIGFVSCQNKEKEAADKRISELERYVDSLKMADTDEMMANWDQIATDFDRKSADVNESLVALDETTKSASQDKINATVAKYDELKLSMETKKAAIISDIPNLSLSY